METDAAQHEARAFADAVGARGRALHALVESVAALGAIGAMLAVSAGTARVTHAATAFTATVRGAERREAALAAAGRRALARRPRPAGAAHAAAALAAAVLQPRAQLVLMPSAPREVVALAIPAADHLLRVRCAFALAAPTAAPAAVRAHGSALLFAANLHTETTTHIHTHLHNASVIKI